MKARLKQTVSHLQCAARYWSSDNASNTGAALAFYCAFSIAPLLVILLTGLRPVGAAEVNYPTSPCAPTIAAASPVTAARAAATK
jgi:uncharacterized BrkB/YihY/UPF0761 family membrane protein